MDIALSPGKSQRGSLVIELAVSIPLLFLLVAGIGHVSLPMLEYAVIFEAAKSGARAGAVYVKNTEKANGTLCFRSIDVATRSLIEAGRNPDDYSIEAYTELVAAANIPSDSGKNLGKGLGSGGYSGVSTQPGTSRVIRLSISQKSDEDGGGLSGGQHASHQAVQFSQVIGVAAEDCSDTAAPMGK